MANGCGVSRPPRSAALIAAALAVALIAAVHPAADEPTERVAVVQPGLLDAAATGPVPAILYWDREIATHEEVADHLRRHGVQATLLQALPAAITCGGGRAELLAMAQAPGAISVWGDEPLTPAFDQQAAATAADQAGVEPLELGVDGEGVGIAVVDTGLDGRHPDLAGRIVRNVRALVSHREYLGPGDPPPCQDIYSDELEDSEVTSGHGTHLAGLAAGNGAASDGEHVGLAPAADLLGVGVSYSVTPDTDVQDNSRLSLLSAVAGFNFALIHGLDGPIRVKVVVAGWVGPGLHDPYHPIYLAIRDLHDFGITVVTPVGNEGAEVSDCSDEDTCLFNPFAVGPYALGVGAFDGEGGLAAFSSRGDPEVREARRLTFRYEPALLAPGVELTAARRVGTANVGTPPGSLQAGGGDPTGDQTDPHYVAMTGTSVAAGYVAGAVALIQHAAHDETGCYLEAFQIREILRTTATPVDGERWEVGAGAIDVPAAVQAAREHERNASRDPWMCP